MKSTADSSLDRIEDRVTLTVPMTAIYQPTTDSKDLVILLHGYQDSAESLFRRLIRTGPLPYSVLAPNSPFPAPIRTEDGYREAYSWFFADRSKGMVLLHPDVSIAAMTQLIERRGLKHHRKILVGFSQGGYFAPFAARGLEGVVKIIGVGCGYRPVDYEGVKVDDVDAVHGDKDEIVSYESAFKGYQELRPHLKSGEWMAIPGLKHGIDDRARRIIEERIASKFTEGRR